MYQPPHFREEEPAIQHALIRAHPLGLLITGNNGLEANPIPFLLDAEKGLLQAHLAKANPQLEALESADEVLIVFQGSESYITPSWYVSKKEHGKTVPTWNYAIVQVRGTPRLLNDRDWLHVHVSALTNTHEAYRAEPWQVTDAPEKFIEGQLKGITGLEIDITSIAAKWKVSQNRPEADRQGVADGVAASNPVMADMVRARATGQAR